MGEFDNLVPTVDEFSGLVPTISTDLPPTELTRVEKVQQADDPALEFARQQEEIARQPISDVPFETRKRGAELIRPVLETTLSTTGRVAGGAAGLALGGPVGAVKGTIAGDIGGFVLGRQLADKVDSILGVEDPSRQGSTAEEVLTDTAEGAIFFAAGELTAKGLSAFGRKALKPAVRAIGNELSKLKEAAKKLGLKLFPSEELGTMVSRDIEKIFATFVTSASEVDKIQKPRAEKLALLIKTEIEKVKGGKDVVQLNNLMADLKKQISSFIGRRVKEKGATLNAVSNKFLAKTLKLPELNFEQLGKVTLQDIENRFDLSKRYVARQYSKATSLLPEGEETLVQAPQLQKVMGEFRTKGFDVDRLMRVISENRALSAIPSQITPEQLREALEATGNVEDALQAIGGLSFSFGVLRDMKTKAGNLGWGRKPPGTEFLSDINTRDVKRLYAAIVDDLSNVKLTSGTPVDTNFKAALEAATTSAKSHIDRFAGNKAVTSLLKKNPDDAFSYMTGLQSRRHIIKSVRAAGGQDVITRVKEKAIREIFATQKPLSSQALKGTSRDVLVESFSPSTAIKKATAFGEENLKEIMGEGQYRKMTQFLKDSLLGERSSVGDEFAKTLLVESPDVMISKIANDVKFAKFAKAVYQKEPEKLAGLILEKALTGTDELGTVIYNPILLSQRLNKTNREALKINLPRKTIEFIDNMKLVAEKSADKEAILKRGGTPGAVSTLFLLRTAARTPGLFGKLLASPKYASKLYFTPLGRKILEEGIFKPLYDPANKLAESELTRLFVKGAAIFARELSKEDYKRDIIGVPVFKENELQEDIF